MTTPVKPKQGGIHPIYGIYLGGAPLNPTYNLETENCFHHVSQVRNVKQANTNESALILHMEDSTKIKFKGNMELTACSSSEFDKDGFLPALKERVKYYGLHNFFYVKDGAKMKYLLDKPHEFTFEQIKKDYENHLNKPSKVEVSGTETAESKKAIHIAYDDYE